MHSEPLLNRLTADAIGLLVEKFNLAQVGLLHLDSDLKIRDVNELACSIAGRPGQR